MVSAMHVMRGETGHAGALCGRQATTKHPSEPDDESKTRSKPPRSDWLSAPAAKRVSRSATSSPIASEEVRPGAFDAEEADEIGDAVGAVRRR